MAIFSSASQPVRRHRAAPQATRILSRALIYGALLFWAFVCLFPIYWTVTTSFKSALDVTQGHLVPWLDFQPDWKGWRSIGLSPDSILGTSTARAEFVSRFENSVITSVGASVLALVLGSLAAYGLSRFRYKFGWMRNDDGPVIAWGLAERVDDYCATSYVYARRPQPVPRLDIAAALADIGRRDYEPPSPMERFVV